MAKKQKLPNRELFDRYYHEIYQERWENLKSAMLRESDTVQLERGLINPYYMDRGSIVAADMLPIREGDNVLDMCAAPGGKTLVLATKLRGTGHLVSNDRSANRRSRLHNVIEESLPEQWRSNIDITNHDSTRWGLYEQDVYDRILLDAPCSSERHVINSEKYLDEWSQTRPVRLGSQQYAMLCAALDAVRVGGLILYSTCSINPIENQNVISKLMKKKGDRVEPVEMDSAMGENLEYGKIILPDVSDNCGPLYFCLLRRKA